MLADAQTLLLVAATLNQQDCHPYPDAMLLDGIAKESAEGKREGERERERGQQKQTVLHCAVFAIGAESASLATGSTFTMRLKFLSADSQYLLN